MLQRKHKYPISKVTHLKRGLFKKKICPGVEVPNSFEFPDTFPTLPINCHNSLEFWPFPLRVCYEKIKQTQYCAAFCWAKSACFNKKGDSLCLPVQFYISTDLTFSTLSQKCMHVWPRIYQALLKKKQKKKT